MSLKAVLARIPYLAAHALEATEEGTAVRVRLPFRREAQNHVGTLHAGALFTAAETAAGLAVWRVVPEGRAVVLLRGARVRYTRRAEADVVAAASVEGDRAGAARAAFAEGGRADVEVDTRVTDPDGAVVIEASFDYALRTRTP